MHTLRIDQAGLPHLVVYGRSECVPAARKLTLQPVEGYIRAPVRSSTAECNVEPRGFVRAQSRRLLHQSCDELAASQPPTSGWLLDRDDATAGEIDHRRGVGRPA